MQYQPFLFNYNIPADNHSYGRPDGFLSIHAACIVTGDGSVTPLCRLVEASLGDVAQVKYWNRAANEIEQIAQQHFQRLVDLDRRLQAEDTLRQINWVEGQDRVAS